ncbi:hypothetical protein HO173_010066 [Letharia columbiana]|uniref:Pentatricopeptide repeat protein n=1 Tax=Letharia columbiana TaxID=112416 RepID=A0A8H6L181_9LECA|nr:uncharacterized protein HO173_010066 [Letharia columbiana]KAF6231764.1 hypothetical protein HO173_010066 [Letharia columbiana]
MIAPHVCLRCSRQLLRWNYQRRSLGFVSLGQLVGRDDDNRITPQEVPLANGDPAAVGLPHRKKRLTFAQKYQEQRKPKGVDKVLETLFASNRENEQTTERSRYSRTPKVHSAKAAAIEISAIERSIEVRLRQLDNRLLRGTAPLQEIWKECECLLGERKKIRKNTMATGDYKSFFSSTSVDTPANFRTFRDVLVAICQKQRLVIEHQDFTPADAIKTYVKYGAMRHWWHLVLWRQLGHVLQLRYQSANDTVGAESDKRTRTLLGEILGVWSVYIGEHWLYPSVVSVPLSGDSNKGYNKTSTSEGFSSSFPKRLSKNPTVEIEVAAAMTLECLKAAGMRAPLQIMSLPNRFGQAPERDRSITTRCLLHAGVSSQIIEKALEGWESLPSPMPTEILEPTENYKKSSIFEDLVGPSQTRQDVDWSEKGLGAGLAEIDKASKQILYSKRTDTERAVELWRQFQAYLEAGKSEDKADSTDQLYARFLRTFWALRRHDHAIEVWNHMINSGHLPGQRHWSAMLTGCVQAKDVESLQNIWTNMLRSGMPPDTHAWTTYIHGLIDCRKWKEGLNALEHLGRIWKSAPPLKSSDTVADRTVGTITADEEQSTEKPKDDTILRPTVAPINAALSALIHINMPVLLPRVLAWARFHQVSLSTVTFNILLRPIVRDGSQASLQAHLQQMADANCIPDVATFSMILNGLVSNPTSTFHTLPPEAQESTITSILADMGRQGIEPDKFTYGTLLDGLLTPENKTLSYNFTPNVPAARTILAHMAARNIHPSSPIYTILITHYFTRRPLPDLPAISSLWSSIVHSGQMKYLDNIFFDRLIEGYADNDKIEESLKFLRMMPEQGKSPGWRALARLLRALVRAREWGLCRELVEDVEWEGGLLRFGQGRMRARHRVEFWELVDILRERGLVKMGDEER